MKDKIKILLVEDNPGDARLLDIYLKDSFDSTFDLSTTPFMAKALELLANDVFDIIILDLSLPDSRGLNTFKKVYEHSPETPIIVLTGLEDESTGINAMKLGAQDFLVKGRVTGKDLNRSINYSIERYKLLKKLSENTRKLEERTADLLKEQHKLADAQKLAHIGSWECEIKTGKMIWSDEMYRIHGLQPHETEITANKIYDMIHRADVDYVKDIIRQSIKKQKPFKFYYRIVLPDKSVKTIHARGEIIVGEEGESLKMVGTGQDVTDRIREEEFEKMALAAAQSSNSFVIADREGKIEWVNEGFTQLTGYKLDDVRNTHGEVLRKGYDTGLSQKTNFYSSILKEKKPVTYESKNFTKDGREFWVITTMTPVLGKNGEVERIIAIESDITGRKLMEERLREANKVAEQSVLEGKKSLNELIKAKKELEESMKVKEQFLANMSHEIRTPMNAIVGFTNLILNTKLTKEQKQYIDAIKTSGENLLVIINDILDFSKIQSGKIVFEQTALRLSQVVSTVIELMLQKSTEKNIRLSSKIDKHIYDNLIGDPTRISQILLNLLGNAIKFTEKGEVKIVIDLVNDSQDAVELKFCVIDTGIGIPQNKLSSIFENFTQATNETTRKFGGTGLGLTIVKQLVELQGGVITVISKEGVGTTFSFNLILKKDKNKAVPKKSSVKEAATDKMVEGINVLLVEDNLLNQILAKKVLTDWKWNVDLAENGVIAVEKVAKNNYDVVLMDIQLPEMDGYEATRSIRSMMNSVKSEIPIIAMTAHAMTGEVEKCLEVGMDDYISKPFDTKVLYSKIINALKKKNSLSNELK